MTLLSLWLMPALASGSSETEAGLNPIWGTVVSSEVAPQVQPEQVFVASKNPVAPNLSAIQAAPISEPAPEALVEEPAPVLVPRRLQAVLGQAPAEAAPPPAEETTSEQTEFTRLLGDSQPTASSPEATIKTQMSAMGFWWMLPLLGLAAAANLIVRRRGGLSSLTGEESPLRIVARQSLSGTTQIVLLEVQDPGGEPRRLLVGTGTEGPRLVSELHPATDFEQLIAESPTAPLHAGISSHHPPTPESRHLRPDLVAEPKPALAPPPPSDPATYASRRYQQVDRISTRTVASPPISRPSLAERRREARKLVDEVLASRGERGWTS